MTTVTATKSTLKTIEKYGFDRTAFDAGMADFGYTTRNEFGCIAIVDDAGESVDFAHPVLVKYAGEKYGNVMTTEMESLVQCGDKWFSTCLDEIEYNGTFGGLAL